MVSTNWAWSTEQYRRNQSFAFLAHQATCKKWEKLQPVSFHMPRYIGSGENNLILKMYFLACAFYVVFITDQFWKHDFLEKMSFSGQKMHYLEKNGNLTHSQVPKTSVNHDVGARRWNLWKSYLVGSWDWGVSQISTGRILHSGQNLRWTGFFIRLPP